MDYSCYRCNTPLEPGKVFCPHCRAPLIRVLAEAVAVPAGQQVDSPLSPPRPVPKPGSIDWSHALPAVLTSGIVAAVLMVPSGGSLGLGLIGSGALAILLYSRRAPDRRTTVGLGAKLGALGGLVGFGFSVVFVTAVTVFSGTERFRSFLLNQFVQAPFRSSNPQAQQYVEFLKTPAGFPNLVALFLISSLLVFLIFSAAGGALGALWVRRRERH